MKKILVALLLSLSVQFMYSQNPVNYNWENVKIGGGGYITGMKIHPLDSNIIYLRTDVGGLYKWDAVNSRMTQIINSRNSNHYGVAGLALHPTNKNIVYAAVDRNNNASQSAIYKSTNRGETWTVIPTQNFKFGANGGRVGNANINDKDREGSPIAVNPNNENELWVGSREKGLWKYNGTWTRVDQATIPDNEILKSIRSIVFHPQNPNAIYVGYFGYGVFKSTNGGNSFQLINGNNNALENISDLSFSKNGTKLYAACRRDGILRLDNPLTSTNWISTNPPNATVSNGSGYLSVTASPFNDNTLAARLTVTGSWQFQRLIISDDNGVTWQRKNNATSNSIFGWNNDDAQAQHNSQVTFDPINPNKMYVTSWDGLWHTQDWQANQVNWTNSMAFGHEETVGTGLVTFPNNNAGNVVGVNSADHAGWISQDPNSYPIQDIQDLTTGAGSFKKGAGITVCESQPSNILLSVLENWEDSNAYLLHSEDGGANFTKATGYLQSWGKSNVAIAANDSNNYVVICNEGVKYSTDRGANFSDATGISDVTIRNYVFPPYRALIADKEDNHTFYIFRRTDARVFKSINKGQTWTQGGRVLSTSGSAFTLTNESNLTNLLSVPGKSGHLWINHHNKGLARSTDGGQTWVALQNVATAKALAIGKEQTPDGYPTLYMLGRLSNTNESFFYRSTNQGASWEQISDASTYFLEAQVKQIAADRTEFGKLYVGTSGLGVWQGGADETPPDPDFIEITSPTASEVLNKGADYEITWNTNITGDVRVVLFKGENYVDQIEFPVPNDGSYTWSVPNTLAEADDYQIRVRSIDNPSIDDYSEFFSLVNPCPASGTSCDDGNVNTVNDIEDGNCNCVGEAAVINITSPALGSIVETGSTKTVLWNTNFSGDVRVVLFKGGNYVDQIEFPVPNNGVYNWSVSNNLTDADDYQIRVRSIDRPDIDDYSEFFSIVEPAVPECDLIRNGTFQNGNVTGWFLRQGAAATGTFTGQWNKGVISIGNPGTAAWNLSLEHDPITLKGGRTYQLKYSAKAWGKRNMSVFVQNLSDNNSVIHQEVVTLENAWNARPTINFTMPSDGKVRISFRVGGNNKTVVLDDITLNELGCPRARFASQNTEDLNLLLYPNPASNSILINAADQSSDIKQVRVFSALGIQLKALSPTSKKAVSNNVLSIDVSDLPAGIYLCKVEGSNWQSSKLFIVKR